MVVNATLPEPTLKFLDRRSVVGRCERESYGLSRGAQIPILDALAFTNYHSGHQRHGDPDTQPHIASH